MDDDRQFDIELSNIQAENDRLLREWKERKRRKRDLVRDDVILQVPPSVPQGRPYGEDSGI